MPDEMIFCPSCNRKVRIPTELLGTAVKCPLCGVVFTSPMPPATAAAAPSYESATTPAPGFQEVDERRSSAGGCIITGPAIALIVTGILGILANAYRLSNVALNRQAAIRQTEEIIDLMKERFPGVPMDTPAEQLVTYVVVTACVFIVGNLIVILGGVQMLRRKINFFAPTYVIG